MTWKRLDYKELTDEQCIEIINRRHKKALSRCSLARYPLPSKETMGQVFQHYINNEGFRCYFCDVEMNITKTINYKLFTFEHLRPLSKGGSQNRGNLVLACICCNSLRGTHTARTFKRFIHQTSEELRRDMFSEVHRNNVHDKITIKKLRTELKRLKQRK